MGRTALTSLIYRSHIDIIDHEFSLLLLLLLPFYFHFNQPDDTRIQHVFIPASMARVQQIDQTASNCH